MPINKYLRYMLRGKPSLTGIILLVMTILSVLPVAAQDASLILSKTTDGDIQQAEVGQIIYYRLRFACSSLVSSCGALQITDTLDDKVSYVPSASSAPAGFTMSHTPGTPASVTITKNDNDFMDGTQFDAVIAVRVNYDYDPTDVTIENTASGIIQPTPGGPWSTPVTSDAPDITLQPPTQNWSVAKNQVMPSIDPTLDTDVTYQIQACPVSATGNVPLSNIQIVDTLPAGVTVVFNDGGTYDSINNTITWTIAGPVLPTDCITRNIVIQYPSVAAGGTYSIGDNVANSAFVIADHPNNTGGTDIGVNIGTDTVPHPLITATANVNHSKSISGNPVGITGTGRFFLNLNTNGSNAPNQSVILQDTMPPELEVTNVTSGTWSNTPVNVRATIEYFDGQNWNTLPGQPVTGTNTSYSAPVSYIRELRWTFEYEDITNPGTYKPGLPPQWSFSSAPEIRFQPRVSATTDAAGTTLPAANAGSSYVNCLAMRWTDAANAVHNEPCANQTATIEGNVASVNVSKAETPGAAYDALYDPNITDFVADSTIVPNDTVRYTITVELTERSSADLINPLIRDVIPSEMIFVRNGTARLDGVALSAINQPTFIQSGSLLMWDFSALNIAWPVLGSRILSVEFFARVQPGASPGTYTNQLSMVSDSVGMVCEAGTTDTDSSDFDSDGNTTETLCTNNDTFVVELSAALRGEKWIRSVHTDNAEFLNSTTMLPDATCPVTLAPGGGNSFTRYPCIAQAFPEGALGQGEHVPPPADTTLDDFEYMLHVFNDGNAPMIDYVLYDILPRVGDTGSGGVLSGTSRGSEFTTALRGPIQFVSGPTGVTASQFTVEYHTSANACRPEVFDMPTGTQAPAGCDNSAWLSAGSVTDWSTIRTFRIRLTSGTLPVSSYTAIRFSVPMFIPADQGHASQISWNSFAHIASYLDTNGDPRHLLASEPRKVGITIPQRMSIGNRVWRDADDSGTINPPDDLNPGIANVAMSLFADYNGDGIPDGSVLDTTVTDANGYYLFSNIPVRTAGSHPNNYIVRVDAANFAAGGPLENLRSSTGVNNNQTSDHNDNGIDNPAYLTDGILSDSFTLNPTGMPSGETTSGNTTDHGITGRGFNAETDIASNLTLDFGFFTNSNRFSIGNRVWLDSGAGANTNNGVMDADESGVAGVRVEIYRDGDGDNIPQADEFVRYDLTDANGFYLFDELDPGTYFVVVADTNFTTGQPLYGWRSSIPTFADDTDRNDNGINNPTPQTGLGVLSNAIVLTVGNTTPTGETDLSGDTVDNGTAHNPTTWDGPGSMGRFGETDDTSNLTIDFGFYPTYSLGNIVWLDHGGGTPANHDNGQRDAGEPGVAGVEVHLLNASGNPVNDPFTGAPYIVTTDANGFYRFDNLPAGDYIVEIATGNFVQGGVLESAVSSTFTEADPNSDLDNNDNGINATIPGAAIRSGIVTLANDAEPLTEAPAYSPVTTIDQRENLTVDFGFVPRYSLGNRVWLDDGIGGGTASDGIMNGAEAGVAGVTVQLLDSAGNPVNDPLAPGVPYTTLTDGSGYYRFDNLPAGDYIVSIPANNFTTGAPLRGTGSTSDNAIGAETDPNLDDDRNDNGIDPTIPYSEVRSGVVTLGPGNSEPTGETDLVISGQGAVDSWANMTVDFGFVRLFSLGNRVWLDDGTGGGTAGDGIQNGAEPGISNVTIHLLDSAGNPVTNPSTGTDYIVTTSLQGYYRFDNLPPGDYIVEVVASNFAGGVLDEMVSSSTTQNDPNTDIDLDDNGLDTPVGGAIRSGVVTLGPLSDEPTGENAPLGQGGADNLANMTVDFGFLPAVYSVGNRVWRDTGAGANTNNGVIDADEVGIAGVEVRLLDSTGTNQIATTTTDADGYYRFDNLPTGDYILEVNASNFSATGALNGLVSSTVTENNPDTDTDNNDNGIDATPGMAIRSGVVTLGPGETEPTGETDLSPTGQGADDNRANMTVDFGFTTPTNTYSLGNRVWLDDGTGGGIENDGLINGGEVGLAGVEVNLLDSSGNTLLATTTTDVNGYYRFDNLVSDSYIVEIAAANFTAANPLDGYTTSTGAEADPNSDADSNDNGLDTFVNGAIRSGLVTLGPGNTEPTGETDLSPTGQGTDDDHANMTVDFGFVQSYSIGNRVWLDDGTGGGTANDGIQNGGEFGLVGIRINLLDSSGNTVLATTFTDANGHYRFDNLPGGDYIVEIDTSNFGVANPLNGLVSSTITEDDPNTDIDQDDNGIDAQPGVAVRSGVVTLGPGDSEPTGETDLATSGQGANDPRANMTVDFGFIAPTDVYSVGNRVWFDDDNNGFINAGESGADGVLVLLLDTTGTTEIATAITADGGYYRFDNLAAGDYILEIDSSNFTPGGVLNGYFSSTGAEADPNGDADNNDNGLDSVINGAIRSGVVTLGPAGSEPTGETDLAPTGQGTDDDHANMTVDFGFFVQTNVYSLGNRVWFDTNSNGVIDPGEPGIGGVVVTLLDSSLNPVDDPLNPGTPYTTTTDANGYYRFDNLPSGDYILRVVEANFNAGSPLENFNSTTPDELLPNDDVDQNDNGIGITPIPGRGIESGIITIGGSTPEPTGETDLNTDGQGTLDELANMTVDFGFVPPTGLIITKDDGLSAVVAGETTTYTITIYNNTGAVAPGVVVTDNFPTTSPNGFDPSTISWTCTATSGANCSAPSGTGDLNGELIGDMPPGSQVVYTVTAQVYPCTAGCAGQIVNTASLNTGEQATDTNGIIFDPPSGVKTGTLVSSTLIHWEMVWLSTANVGQNVVITDTLQAGQTFAGNLSCTPQGLTTTTSCSISGNTIRWEGTLHDGNANQLIIGFDVTVPGNNRYRNTATLSMPGTNVNVTTRAAVGNAANGDDQDDDNQGNTSADEGPAVCPALSLTVNASVGGPGTPHDWTISTTNPIDTPLSNVFISVPIPDALDILEIIAPQDAVIANTNGLITILIPSMPPGTYPDILIRTRIDKDATLPFDIQLTASMEDCISASASVVSVDRLPETGEVSPISGASLLLMAIVSIAGLVLLLVRWRHTATR